MAEVLAGDRGKHLEGKLKNIFYALVTILGFIILVEAVLLIFFLP